MVYFVGAGSGDPELITLKGYKLLQKADTVIYAGSLVNKEILTYCKDSCKIYNSAEMTLEEIIDRMVETEKENKLTVRLHTGDPSLYGAINEQIDCLNKLKISWQIIPGVSSFCGAAAAVGREYTVPNVSQSVIITRMAGRTPVPERESMKSMAQHGCSMVIFLSSGLTKEVQQELVDGAYDESTPCAIVYKATWNDQKVIRTTLGNLHKSALENNITKTALILVGDFLNSSDERSLLYHPNFETEFRKANNQ